MLWLGRCIHGSARPASPIGREAVGLEREGFFLPFPGTSCSCLCPISGASLPGDGSCFSRQQLDQVCSCPKTGRTHFLVPPAQISEFHGTPSSELLRLDNFQPSFVLSSPGEVALSFRRQHHNTLDFSFCLSVTQVTVLS